MTESKNKSGTYHSYVHCIKLKQLLMVAAYWIDFLTSEVYHVHVYYLLSYALMYHHDYFFMEGYIYFQTPHKDRSVIMKTKNTMQQHHSKTSVRV